MSTGCKTNVLPLEERGATWDFSGLCLEETTIDKPATPNEFDHRPLPGQQSVPCVRAATTAEETNQQFLDTHPTLYASKQGRRTFSSGRACHKH
eukprot:74429-Pelagomonas_calceolata.AAC.1